MLLSIVVLSYNRPRQIARILQHFVGVESNDFNIVIKDDVSPRQHEIREVVNQFSNQISVDLVFHANEKNLGYDRNLMDSFQIVDSDYVFLLSDDDYLEGSKLSLIIEVLSKREYHLYFTPYMDGADLKRNIKFKFDPNHFSSIIYNSILFSGLIFNRQAVCDLELNIDFLSNCIYSQVYIASILVYHQADYGLMPPGVLYLGGDGENYFGKNESAINSDLLADRAQISANLNYQKFLLRVVEEISKDTTLSIMNDFISEYKKRLIGYGFKARSIGLKKYFSFFKTFSSSRQREFWGVTVVLLGIFFIPAFLSRGIYSAAVSTLRRSG